MAEMRSTDPSEGSTGRPAPKGAPGGRAPRASHAFAVRLHVAWRGVPIDTLSLASGRRVSGRLRSGARVAAHLVDAPGVGPTRLWVRIDDGSALSLEPGVPVLDASGYTLAFEIGAREPRGPSRLRLDARWLHALMVAMALQICAVSALLLAPARVGELEPGAGVPVDQLRRVLRVASGSARQAGPPVFLTPGRAPEEAERIVEPTRPSGAAREARRVRHREPTVADTLAAIVASLNNGVPGVDLRRTIGDLALSTARSEQLGAGFGGLPAPRLLDAGSGSGIVDIGTAPLSDRLRRQRELLEPVAKARFRRAPSLVGPVSKVDVPSGEVALDGLDPVVRDHIARAVRARKKSVRYCYESWGLAADPNRQGRLVLEMTLRPDGRLDDVRVTVNDRSLHLVADCVEEQVREWYLGDGLVEEPQRLSFPFLLHPKRAG